MYQLIKYFDHICYFYFYLTYNYAYYHFNILQTYYYRMVESLTLSLCSVSFLISYCLKLFHRPH